MGFVEKNPWRLELRKKENEASALEIASEPIIFTCGQAPLGAKVLRVKRVANHLIYMRHVYCQYLWKLSRVNGTWCLIIHVVGILTGRNSSPVVTVTKPVCGFNPIVCRANFTSLENFNRALCRSAKL